MTWRFAGAWLALLVVAACSGDAPPARIAAAASAMEFQGQRPCADCLGIEASLRLEEEGGTRSYVLVERFHGARGERRFQDAGEWTSDGDLLRLRSSDGGERVYARLADDSLHARDSSGRPLPEAADDVLVPVSFDRLQ